MFQNQDSRFSPLFLVISCFFVTTLLLSNLIAGKLVSFSGIVLPAAVILFPVTYIFGDILTEVYGFRKARLIIWMGLGANLLMVFIFMIALALPYPEFWKGQSAYAAVLGFTPRVVTASLTAYFVGEFFNSVVLSRLKVKTAGRNLWVRTIGSTIAGEGVDTVLFIAIAFWGSMSSQILFGMMAAQYLWKVGYEILLTPVTYMIVKWVKRQEKMDVYDTGVTYNPFSLEA